MRAFDSAFALVLAHSGPAAMAGYQLRGRLLAQRIYTLVPIQAATTQGRSDGWLWNSVLAAGQWRALL
ncbi:MAG: hypothetical protein R2854_12100 [Caldilineaceae bacterium]